MYALAAIPEPCPLCRNSIGSGTLACTACEIPPLRMEIPEKVELSVVIRLIAFRTAPETCCRDIGSGLPFSTRKLAKSGGQCGHRAAGLLRLVHSADTAKFRSPIMACSRRTMQSSRVEPRNNLGYNPFRVRSCLRLRILIAAEPRKRLE